MDNQHKLFTVFVACLDRILTGAKAIIRSMSVLIVGIIGLLAESATASEDDAEYAEGNLIGDYNFRTRKLDNGTDPYGWYEEDM